MKFFDNRTSSWMIVLFFILGILFLPQNGNAFVPNSNGASASKVFGQSDLDSNTAGDSSASGELLAAPAGLSRATASELKGTSEDHLWVADDGNDRIVVYALDGDTDAEVLHADTKGIGDFGDRFDAQGGGLNRPTRLDVYTASDTNILFVTDNNNHRVLAYVLSTIDTGFYGDIDASGGPHPTRPEADTYADYVFGQSGFDTNLANGPSNYGEAGAGDQTIADSAAHDLNFPIGIDAVDSGSEIALYVSDSGNDRVIQYTLDKARLGKATRGASLDTDAATVWGDTDLDHNQGIEGTSDTMVDKPDGLAVSNGRLYVADSNNNRVVVDTDVNDGNNQWSRALGQPNITSSGSTFSDTGLDTPGGIAVRNGNVGIADSKNNRVVFETTGDSVFDRVIGDTDFKPPSWNGVSTSPADTHLDGPSDLIAGSLWIADRLNNRVVTGYPSGSSSDDNVCLIARTGTPDYALEPLRQLRDRMLNTAVGRWVTDAYYRF